jgi:hypothetical protein
MLLWQLNLGGQRVSARVSWVQFDAGALPRHARVSWVQFNTQAGPEPPALVRADPTTRRLVVQAEQRTMLVLPEARTLVVTMQPNRSPRRLLALEE